jgi:hypothetical protein
MDEQMEATWLEFLSTTRTDVLTGTNGELGELLKKYCCYFFKAGFQAAGEPRLDPWVPCSERLPTETGSYLVTGKGDPGDEPFLGIVNFDGTTFSYPEFVTAWMRKVAPYNPEKEAQTDAE